MNKNALFIAGLILFDGAAVAWAAWEFWKIRPGRPDKAEAISALDRAPAPGPQTLSERPEAPGHSKREHGSDQR